MSIAEYTEWLKSLKPGDAVDFYFLGGRKRAIVESVTDSTILASGGTFRRSNGVSVKSLGSVFIGVRLAPPLVLPKREGE